MPIRIGVFGGSFDPPHIGHKILAEKAIEQLKLDKLLVLVAKQNPFKLDKTKTSFESRLQFCLDFFDNPKVEVTDFETKVESNKTYDVLVELQQYLKDAELYFVMGADNLVQFHKWYKWQDIANIAHIAVMNRDNLLDEALRAPAATYLEKINKKVIIISRDLIDISSTNIRENRRI